MMLPWQQPSGERDQNTRREENNDSSGHTVLIFVHHFDFKKLLHLNEHKKVMIQRETGLILIQWVIKYNKSNFGSAQYTHA